MVVNNVELIKNSFLTNSSWLRTDKRWKSILFMLFLLMGNLSLSAQCMADGGTISTMDNTNICIDGTPDPIDVIIADASGMNSGWIITDNMNNILALPPAPPFDLDGVGVGICIIWHIQYENDLAGNMAGNNLSDLTGCYGLSDGITVNREIPDAGTVTLTDGSTSYAACGRRHRIRRYAHDNSTEPFLLVHHHG